MDLIIKAAIRASGPCGKDGVKEMECIITKSSIINKCNTDEKLHLLFSAKEKPCEEAYIKELSDSNGNMCSRYFIDLDTIVDLDKLGKKYDVDVLVTENLDFQGYIALVLYEEIMQGDWG